MSKPSVSFTAAGDYLGQRRIPVEDKGFAAVSSYIRKGNVRLFNLLSFEV